MTLSHRIAIDPTQAQRRYFERAAGTARFVFNWALAEWNAQYEAGGKPKASEIKRYFNSVKYERFPWLREIHRDAHSQPFANLHKAFRGFFSGKSKRPKFKKKGKCRDSFYVACDKLRVSGTDARLPVIGTVRLAEELRFVGKIQSATISREADRWFISISVEMSDAAIPTPAGDPVGVDLGLTAFATFSTGEKVDAPKPLKRAQRKLRRFGRWHSRKQAGSKNRTKATMKLARQYARIKNVRQDFIHKLTTRLAKTHSEICIEDLNVKGMVKNHNLALHIGDAAWGEARRQLEYKTVMYGSALSVRDRFFPSSKTCSACGFVNRSLKLKDRQWTCSDCGSRHDRDTNAAINLIKPTTAGYAGSNAHGDRSSGAWMAPRETTVGEVGTNREALTCVH